MFKGSIVALVTPMKKNGDIDFISLKKLINIHISNGTNAIVIGGTTGEASTLSIPEHYELIEKSIEYSNGKIPIIAGTGSNNTKEAIEWTSEAKRVGSDACLIVTPYYNNPTQEGLYKHFKTIADNVDIPQILYNVPSRTGYSIEIDIVKKLSNHKNIIGIKEASGNLEYCARLLEVLPDDFFVYSGDDATALDLMLLGGEGNISVTANILPKEMAKLCELGLRGEYENALLISKNIASLNNVLFCESNPIPIKWALGQLGLIDEGIRLPLTTLNKDQQTYVSLIMKEHKKSLLELATPRSSFMLGLQS